ncbi:hypothetical protein PM10SUCC1_10920 [Propionigenium maris DSM 9537]|uniref:Organic solvent tolerance-like N-terminal domain-containing protein n=1 Tax=Propionigenium maris DSM 9537 TaxID=1123000 RepID=A0A9W6LML5_9FUSO|nr:OstA-like protein [Propionigenium maris]GLI55578.1 hypothetical protein PM10SUCC1_10920 [Propionigenium maris DSM 9537]
MQKKYIYTAVTLVALVLGYLNYYREETPIEGTGENIVETSDVVYESGEYQIEAEKQVDDLDKDETKFAKARALFEDMNLSGDNVFIDSVKNLILENNIMGVSTNGWKFNTEKARYSNEEEKIYSTEGVTAYNEEKDLRIYGLNFETDNKMSYVKLQEAIEVKSEKFTLNADKAYYDDATKVVDIEDNIVVNAKNMSDDAKGDITGEFKKAKYNTETGILEAWEPFVMNYNGIDLYGERLWYDENTGNFRVWENVRAEQDGFVLYMDEIDYVEAENLVTFKGKLHGGDDIYKIKADNGYYNTLTKVAELKGNIVITSTDGKKIVADKGTYDTESNELVAVGVNRDVIYTSPEGKVVSKKARYNTETEELFLDQKYTFEDEEYVSVGEKLYYNNLTGKGRATKGDIKGRDFYGRGDVIDFDTFKKYHVVTGNGYFKQGEYELTGDRVIYNEAANEANIPEEYLVVNPGKREKFRGRGVTYNTVSGALYSPGRVNGENPQYTFSGIDLHYNNLTGEGRIERDVKLRNRDDGTTLTGNRSEFKRGEYAKLMGNVVLKSEDYTAYGNEADYREKEGKVYIPGKIRIDGKDSAKGTMYDGVFELATNTYTGKNFVGKTEGVDAKGDVIKYYLDREVFELIGNLDIRDPETRITGEQAEYHTQNGDVYAQKPFTIYYSNMVIDSTRGKFNLKSKNLDGENVVIVTDKDERLEGNQVYGSFLEKKVDITGDVRAKLYNIDEKTGKRERVDYNGDTARVYFIDDNGYKATRSEIRDNGVFKYQGMTLYSDYVEVDFQDNLALGRQGSRILMDNGTDIVSEIADMNLNTEVVELLNDVEITSLDPKNGYKKATADKGIIRNKEQVAELEGRVRAETDTATIDADRGIYDMNTDRFRAMGNVFINYNIN